MSEADQVVKSICQSYSKTVNASDAVAYSKLFTTDIIWTQIAAGLVLSLVAVAGLVWWQPWEPDVEPASVDRMAFPLPDKPSIALVPFDNLSGDPRQQLFVAGIVSNITIGLSRFPDLFVIAYDSTATYKNKPVEMRQVAEDLGVRYLVTGNIQKGAEQIRIAVSLIDALTGEQVWAERYDGKLSDVFTLQDEITEKIVAALFVELDLEARERLKHRGTESLDAYDPRFPG